MVGKNRSFETVLVDQTCGYYDKLQSRLRFLELENPTLAELDFLLQNGFRRTGYYYYTTECKNCYQCLSLRVNLHALEFTKSQKRNLKENSDLRFFFQSPEPTDEKLEIYLRYIQKIHGNKKVPFGEREYKEETENDLTNTFHFQLYTNPKSSLELQVFEGEKLVSFGIYDVGKNNVSAVYQVYDPDHRKRGLGIYNILISELEFQKLGYAFYHLGYYLPGHSRMDYKIQFGSSEIKAPKRNDWEKKDVAISKLEKENSIFYEFPEGFAQ